MLTAHKDNSALETEPMPQRLPTTRSFDRVVNSIEGLRGRVQGFTLEQVSDAEQKLRTIAVQLDELQQTVDALVEMKHRMGRLQEAVQQAEAESLEQNKRITMVDPIPVQSIARMGTLLKFRRVLKVLQETKSSLKVSRATDFEAKGRLRPIPVEIPTDQSISKQELAADSARILERVDTRPANANFSNYIREALAQTKPLSDPTTVEMDLDSLESFAKRPGDVVFDDVTTAFELPEITAEFDDTREEPPASHEAIFSEFKGTRDMELDLTNHEKEKEETDEQRTKSASEEMDFDQRLLDDLIKNYGEFSISPSSKDQLTDEAIIAPKSETLSATPRANSSLPGITSQNLPSLRKDGELDQKLKKLIKDYGEYDLYSRQTPAKLKTAVVAAFILLTLIFSGFYFFSSFRSTVPSEVPTTSPSAGTLDKTPKATPANDKIRGDETPLTPSVSNVDVPKTTEAGSSQSAPNNKKIK